MGVYDSPGPKQSVFGEFEPWVPNLGSKGLWEPNKKICTLVTKTYNMGYYGLPWTPATSFVEIRTLGAKFGSKGLLEPN